MEKIFVAIMDWFWTWAFPPLMAFVVTVVRGIYSEDDCIKTFLEGCIIASITLSIKPLFSYLEIPEDLAIFIGVLAAVFGLKWIKELGDAIMQKWINK